MWCSSWRLYLDQVVEQSKGDDSYEEDGRAVGDDEDGRDRHREVLHPESRRQRDVHVERVDVSREPVDDAAERRRVEEGHWRAQDLREDLGVEEA